MESRLNGPHGLLDLQVRDYVYEQQSAAAETRDLDAARTANSERLVHGHIAIEQLSDRRLSQRKLQTGIRERV